MGSDARTNSCLSAPEALTHSSDITAEIEAHFAIDWCLFDGITAMSVMIQLNPLTGQADLTGRTGDFCHCLDEVSGRIGTHIGKVNINAVQRDHAVQVNHLNGKGDKKIVVVQSGSNETPHW